MSCGLRAIDQPSENAGPSRRAAQRSLVVMACVLLLSAATGCDQAKLSGIGSALHEVYVSFTDPHPERLVTRTPLPDAGPMRSPVIVIDHDHVQVEGQELPVPGPVARWIELLGPATRLDGDQHVPVDLHAAPVSLKDDQMFGSCWFYWNDLGIVARGPFLRRPGETFADCRVERFELALDNDERWLEHPPTDFQRRTRLKHNFPGTLIVETVRMTPLIAWSDFHDFWRDRGLKCPWTTSTLSGPRGDMRCYFPASDYRYFTELTASGDEPRRVRSFVFEYSDPSR